MYSFLRRPAWILSHVLIAVLVVSLVGLGFWQRERYHEEKEKKELLEERASGTPAPFDEVVAPDVGFGSDVSSLRYERVVLTGTWDVESEVAILNRSQGGLPGAWVLTPLVREDGSAVAVVRGWIPYDPAGETPPFPDALPPEGVVTVTGNLQGTQRRGSIGAVDPAEGVLTSLARVDLERFARQYDHDLAPVWVLQDGQHPSQEGEFPRQVLLQTQDPSQNFSYMMQWWIFALIAACGYPLVLRAVARHRARDGQLPAVELPGDDASAPREAPVPDTADHGPR